MAVRAPPPGVGFAMYGTRTSFGTWVFLYAVKNNFYFKIFSTVFLKEYGYEIIIIILVLFEHQK